MQLQLFSFLTPLVSEKSFSLSVLISTFILTDTSFGENKKLPRRKIFGSLAAPLGGIHDFAPPSHDGLAFSGFGTDKLT
jgi:hypothetical protein